MPVPESVFGSADRRGFPATHWTQVLMAGRSDSPEAAKALASLCQAYWYPLYGCLRRQGHGPQDAEDLTQAFLAHLLQNRRLAQVSPEKGRFRTFLHAALRNFLCDQWDKARALKRGGPHSPISFDAVGAEERLALEPKDPLDPAKAFERRWAMTVLQRVMDRLEREHEATTRQNRFEQLRDFLLPDSSQETYAEAGRRLGMTEGAVKVAVLRLRQRYRELFRDEIVQTVAGDGDADDEVRHLLAALS